MNITEDYCSYEVAKLLKEKGFDWDCITYYVDSEPNDVKYSMLFENNNTWEDRCCSAPTHQMAMKWLREEKNISIIPDDSEIPLSYRYIIRRYGINDKYSKVVVFEVKSDTLYIKYEEAVEAALKYVLENLI